VHFYLDECAACGSQGTAGLGRGYVTGFCDDFFQALMVENFVDRTTQLIQLEMEELFQCCPWLFVNPAMWVFKDGSEQRAAAHRVRKGHVKNLHFKLPMIQKKFKLSKIEKQSEIRKKVTMEGTSRW
jgi:hypothetical protein